MTRALRTARAHLFAAAALIVGALHIGMTEAPWQCLPGLCLAAVLVRSALRSYAEHRAVLSECERARCAAIVEELDMAVECCRLAHLSGGYAHGKGCMLSADAFAELYTACCAEGFVSRGARHWPTCRVNSASSSAL